jgi:hypothetical protein
MPLRTASKERAGGELLKAWSFCQVMMRASTRKFIAEVAAVVRPA